MLYVTKAVSVAFDAANSWWWALSCCQAAKQIVAALLDLTGSYCLVFETNCSFSFALVLQLEYGFLSLAAGGGCMQFLPL